MAKLFSFKKDDEDVGAAKETFAEGLQFMDLKQYDAAIKELQLVLKATSDIELTYDALHHLGMCYFHSDKFKEAISSFDKAIKNAYSGDKKSFSYYYKGIGVLKKNKHDAKTFSIAFDCFDKAVELNPKDLDAAYMKGCMESELGEAKAASQSFANVLQVNSQFENFFENDLFNELQERKPTPQPKQDVEVKPKEFKTKVGLRVTNYPELIIANFLYDNDIKFQYKPLATWAKENFEPLFYLPKFDVYLEHFAEEDEASSARLQTYAAKNKHYIYTTAQDEEDLSTVLKVKLKDFVLSQRSK